MNIYKGSFKNMKGDKSHWSCSLINCMSDNNAKLKEDNQIVVLQDKYPKARYHYLILPKKDISSINKVTKDDLKLLDYMETIANKYVDSHKKYEFLIGYHAIPSLYHLHLHVISTDFNSPYLKTRKHWNSFTTPYFLPSIDVRKQLEKYGRIEINTELYNKYLNKNLQCHKCSYHPKNMPDLKIHIIKHITTAAANAINYN